LTSVPPNVFRDLFSAFLVTAAVVHAAGRRVPQQSPGNESPTNQSSGNASPSATDPAAILFTTDAGMVLHAVKPGSAADYEAAILALKEALATATDPETQKLAAGWRIFKATEPDAKSSVIYVHWLDPVVAGVDYRPSLWLDKLLAGAPAEVLAKYRDSFAVPPTKLSLTEVKKP
jgi:hypothetical protein